MEIEKYLPVSADHPTVFYTPHGGEKGTFDVQPFLRALEYYNADGMAIILDDIMQELTTHYLDLGEKDTTVDSKLYTIRLLRNALLKGGGLLNFDQ